MSFVYKGTVEKKGALKNGLPNKGGPLFILVNPSYPFQVEIPNNNLDVFYTKELEPDEALEFLSEKQLEGDLKGVTGIKVFNVDDSKPGEIIVRQITRDSK